MNKIIIEVRGGIVQAVYNSVLKPSDLQYLIIDHDLIDRGQSPVTELYEPDNTFEPGHAYEMFSNEADPHEVEIRDELKRIKF